MLMAVCSFVGANAALNRANNFLALGDATAEAGKTVVVNVLMTNNKSITEWATELVLPEGVTLVSAVAAENWTAAVTVDGNKIGSTADTAVGTLSAAVVAKVTLQVAETVEAGDYDIALKGTVMISEEAGSIQQLENKVAKLTVTPAQGGEKGDLNGDGKVTASDIQVVLNDMAENLNNLANDLNGDGKITASDIQVILNIMAEQ